MAEVTWPTPPEGSQEVNPTMCPEEEPHTLECPFAASNGQPELSKLKA